MATIASLIVNIAADTAELRRNMEKANKAVDKFQTKHAQSMRALGKAMAIGGAAVGGLAIAAVKGAVEFESSFAGIRKTVNATEQQFDALAQGMRDLSTTIPINVNELNRIGEAAGQLGIKTEAILGFTEVMAKLGIATNLSAEQAATSLAQLANITQMPQESFERLGSVVVDLGNNLATTEEQIVEFGLRIAASGKLAGLTEADILSIGGAMASMGIKAEAGGTAVQKVLNAMTQSVALGGEELAVFANAAGLSADQFATAYRENAANAFTLFVEGLGRQGDQAFATLENLGLGNERVIRSFISLAGSGDTLRTTLERGQQAWIDNTALTKEAEERFKTTASQLTLLWNVVKDLGLTFGNLMLPMLNQAVSALQRLTLASQQGEAAALKFSKAIVLLLRGADFLQLGYNALVITFEAFLIGLKSAAKGMVDFLLKIASLAEKVPLLGRAFGDTTKQVMFLQGESDRLAIEIDNLGQGMQQAVTNSIEWGNELLELGIAVDLAAQKSLEMASVVDADTTAMVGAAAAADGYTQSLQGVIAGVRGLAAERAAIAVAGLVPRGTGGAPLVRFADEARRFAEGQAVFGQGVTSGGIVSVGAAPTAGGGGVRAGSFGSGGVFGGGFGFDPSGFITSRPIGPGVTNPFTSLQPSTTVNLNIVQNSLVNDPRAKDELRRIINEVLSDGLRRGGTRLQTV